LVADVTLTAKVYGINGKWTLDTTVDFEKIDGKWYFSKWDNWFRIKKSALCKIKHFTFSLND